MRELLLTEEKDALGAIRQLLRDLLIEKQAAAVYVPLEGEGGMPLPALVSDPALLERANPLLPVMPINGARAVSALTARDAGAPIAAVLRACEVRALVELVKLKQASLENLTLVGIDCLGSYSLRQFAAARQAGQFDLNAYLQAASAGEAYEWGGESWSDGRMPQLRAACQVCLQPEPQPVDIHLRWFTPQALEQWRAQRRQAREQEHQRIRERLSQDGGLAALFAACIRCHNCMVACPICYCRTCLFRTASFEHEPSSYLRAARRKGAARLLGDTLLFHLTRMNHMGASCVSCGMCSQACPADIPVGTIFSAVGEQVQALFDYQPGRDVAEPLPLITFQPDEWAEVGEEDGGVRR